MQNEPLDTAAMRASLARAREDSGYSRMAQWAAANGAALLDEVERLAKPIAKHTETALAIMVKEHDRGNGGELVEPAAWFHRAAERMAAREEAAYQRGLSAVDLRHVYAYEAGREEAIKECAKVAEHTREVIGAGTGSSIGMALSEAAAGIRALASNIMGESG